jgi:nucleotide-binding universal stress UspA family protein
MKTIIAATDFSRSASNAVVYAADMALTINANLLLLHVYQYPVNYGEAAVIVNIDDIRKDAERLIEDLKYELEQKTSGKMSIETETREGAFFHELAELCGEVKPYAVVLGSQGSTAAERFFFGSQAVHTMKHLKWPVITVPPEAKFTTVNKIGFACDFEKVVDTTPIEEIKLLVNDFHATLHVLNTGKQQTYNPNLVFQSGMMQELLADLKPEYHFINDKDIDEGTIRFAEENQVDLLVVLPKRHSLAEKLVHKNHTRQFVLHSHVPVMALHQ